MAWSEGLWRRQDQRSSGFSLDCQFAKQWAEDRHGHPHCQGWVPPSTLSLPALPLISHSSLIQQEPTASLRHYSRPWGCIGKDKETKKNRELERVLRPAGRRSRGLCWNNKKVVGQCLTDKVKSEQKHEVSPLPLSSSLQLYTELSMALYCYYFMC